MLRVEKWNSDLLRIIDEEGDHEGDHVVGYIDQYPEGAFDGGIAVTGCHVWFNSWSSWRFDGGETDLFVATIDDARAAINMRSTRI
jgi:hypothetical protein